MFVTMALLMKRDPATDPGFCNSLCPLIIHIRARLDLAFHQERQSRISLALETEPSPVHGDPPPPPYHPQLLCSSKASLLAPLEPGLGKVTSLGFLSGEEGRCTSIILRVCAELGLGVDVKS